MRGEVEMALPSDACSTLRRSIRRAQLGVVLATLACALAGTAGPAWSEEDAAKSPPRTSGAPATRTPDSAAADTVMVVSQPAPAPDGRHDEQRRALILLLMNSAGPVRPFGNLAR